MGRGRSAAAAAADVEGDRRAVERQRPVKGGSRLTDPPLTPRDVATWTGFSIEWVRIAILDGITNHRGEVCKLAAETMVLNGRTIRRIHLDEFHYFLRCIGFDRLPALPH